MSYINQIELLKLAVQAAIKDRLTFIDAISNSADESSIAEVKADIARFRLLLGIPFKEAIKADEEAVRLAFVYGEQYYTGLAVAQVGREKELAAGKFKLLNDFRLKKFGRTKFEAHVATCKSVPVFGPNGILSK